MGTNIGKKIKEKRLEYGWSLDKLAQKSRISKTYLWQLEENQSDRPSGEKLYNLALALDLSIAELLGKKLNKVIMENGNIPVSLEKAAIENNWNTEDKEMLLGVAMRASKNKAELSPKDWMHIYETITRETDRTH